MAQRSDTERVILDVLEQVESGVWVSRYLGSSRSLSRMVDRLWRERFPLRRNRPTHQATESALARLIAEGLVEKREGENDAYYRKVQ